jgi:hypothetical protein
LITLSGRQPRGTSSPGCRGVGRVAPALLLLALKLGEASFARALGLLGICTHTKDVRKQERNSWAAFSEQNYSACVRACVHLGSELVPRARICPAAGFAGSRNAAKVRLTGCPRIRGGDDKFCGGEGLLQACDFLIGAHEQLKERPTPKQPRKRNIISCQ